MAQTAGQMTHKAIGQVQKTAGNTGVVHNGTGSDEEGNCKVGCTFGDSDDTLNSDLNGQHGLQENEVRQRAAQNGQPNGNVVNG